MPASLSFDAYGDGIGAAATVLRQQGLRAGPSTPVPTCPGWDLRALVAHQGMVHRWAAASLRGEGDAMDTDAVERDGAAATDQLDWFDQGVRDLLQALVDAPEDLPGPFFLRDAAAPKYAWARRQCHETGIHAVDAMAAALGRPPTSAETWIRPGVAVDGVDELLTGFLPRRPELPGLPPVLLVYAEDADVAWRLRTSGPVVAEAGAAPDGSGDTRADAVVTGSAVDLYLWLWNRGGDVRTDAPDLSARWRRAVEVGWS